jgi:hypothetical protein
MGYSKYCPKCLGSFADTAVNCPYCRVMLSGSSQSLDTALYDRLQRAAAVLERVAGTHEAGYVCLTGNEFGVLQSSIYESMRELAEKREPEPAEYPTLTLAKRVSDLTGIFGFTFEQALCLISVSD